jgi:protein ImuB
MPLAEATALSDIHFEQHDSGADQAALLKLAAWCEQFSPIVGLFDTDNLCLDVTGLGALFGSEESLAQLVIRAFHRFRLRAQVAIADTLGAAWAMSHFGNTVVVPPGHTEALADLPVAALRLDREAEILAELGIHQIGQLLSLPREALAARFDPPLLLRLDQATGLVPETIVSHRAPPDIVAETQLEYATDDRRAVDMILSQLMARITGTLSNRQEGAIRLECEVRCEAGEPIKFLVGLFRASANCKHLLELTQMQLDRLILSSPIVAIRLSVLIAARIQTWQPELFEPSRREGQRQVSVLIDRLSSRLGREAVVRAVPQAESQPELAFRYEPLAGVLARKSKKHWKRLPRPLRLEPKPIPLEVLSVVPDGPPIRFQFHGSHQVAKSWGPERIQTGWWRGRYVQRDYYRVETSEGKRFWLFRRLHDGKWFLHGVFD